MAGTRLRIVSIFVSTLLVWVGWTICGSRLLSQDVRIQRLVAMALYHLVRAVQGCPPQPLLATGSFKLQALQFPPLVVTVGTSTTNTVATTNPNGALDWWGNTVQIVLVQPKDPDYWNQACADPQLLFHLDQTKASVSRWESLSHTDIHVPYPDIVVCDEPFQESGEEASRIVWVPVSKTSTTMALFYPSRRSVTLSASQLLLQPLFGPMNDDSLLAVVRLVLVMEPTVPHWKDIVELVSQRAMTMDSAYATTTTAAAARVVNRVEVQVDRSVWFDREPTTANIAGSHTVDLEHVQAVLTKRVRNRPDGQRLLDVVLYVPSTPLHLSNAQDNAVALDGILSGGGDTFLFLVNLTQQMIEPVAVLSAVEATLNRIQQQLLGHSWRLPSSSSTDNVSVQVLSRNEGGGGGGNSQTSAVVVVMVPSLQQTWRASALLLRRWETVQQAAQSAHAILVAATPTATRRVEAYESAWEHLQQAHGIATILASTTAHNESFALLVDQVHHWLDEAESDFAHLLEDFDDWAMPVVDLPIEQYAAIFLPLLFPLLVPVLVTLLREYQRYRALVLKQRGGRGSIE
jgi:Phosphatidylinositol-glycan biosynthesis class S protein